MEENPTSLRVADPGIRDLFTLDSRWQAWLDVEAALALAEAELGMVPDGAAAEIVKKCKLELLDRDAIIEGLRRTAHPLVPLVWELSKVCDGDAGNYVHWGATTQNITQTGNLIVLRQAHEIFLRQLADILTAMADLAERGADMVLPGRTHGQHAVPATFGYKVAVWIAEIASHVERLRGIEPRIFTVLLGGAAGTLASFDGKGYAVQDGVAKRLGMTSMPMPSRAMGDHQAEYVCLLGLMAATCSKIGREVYTLMKQEFGEVEEPVPPGTVGSSTMPQKRNPKLSQDIIAAAMQVRALVPQALESMQTEHEADRTTSITMNHALQEASAQMGDILSRMTMMLEGMTLNPERMRQNLDLTDGMIMAETLMLSLGETIGRQEAHDVIYDAAQAAATGAGNFTELLEADAKVQAHMTSAQVRELLDPTAYIGECAAMARTQADRARKVAADINAS
ncbi:MAG: adenylosuccinate lyase family protein [Rhodospirillaceae bacterium]|jgi:3-carboxy-cis,cis-muconate cycloisomerase|nr:adenylosuccinate lyase family protein [Rhodospirillaceae bacterium]MBT5665744.1 adenylosuccinate lyase family protein [Rhodospirillaceae bacterium]MBT5811389.1 adenylosuccinate lyase family protein [Rhodospirillaceae bacterium]